MAHSSMHRLLASASIAVLLGCQSASALLVHSAGREGHQEPASSHIPVRLTGGYALIDISIAGQAFSALVDTGSSSVAVASAQCDAPGCQGHRHFYPEDDDAGKFLGTDMSDLHVGFATASLAGSGFETSSLCLSTTACGRVSIIVGASESKEFTELPFDAILGLGLPQQAPAPTFGTIRELTRQGHISSEVFQLSLRKDGDSFLALGSRQEKLQQASWLNLLGRADLWRVGLKGASVGSRPLSSLDVHDCGAAKASTCGALIDSGCPGLVLPRAAVAQLEQEYPLDSCSPATIARMPELVLTLSDGLSYRIAPENLIEISSTDTARCRLLVHAIDDESTSLSVIFGLPFLLGRDVTFDEEHRRIAISGGTRESVAPSNGGAHDDNPGAKKMRGALLTWLTRATTRA